MTDTSEVFQVLRRICNTLWHQCIAVITIYVVWIAVENYSSLRSWHVILCSLGVVPLMAEAVILFSGENVWSREIPRKRKYWLHGVLITTASVFVIAGIGVEIENKTRKTNSKHFVSAHAITGLLAMIFVVFGLVCGLLAFFSSRLSKYAQPVWFKLAHNIVGQFGYIMGAVCLCLGYHTGWFSRRASEDSRTAATIATAVVVIWSLISAWKSVYRYLRPFFAALHGANFFM